MPILEIRRDSNRQLQEIADVLAKSKKVVVVTGAGISTNIGIPVSKQDFESVLVATNHETRIFDQRTVSML